MGVPLTLSQVPNVNPYIQYVASPGQTVFPYPFPITQDSDLVVVVSGVTLGTDTGYTLSGQGQPNGGNVTFTLGQSGGAIITLFRNIAIQRITQIGQNSGYSSITLNAEFNNLYLIAQQLQESIALCLQVPNTNSPAPTTSLVPGSYANKYLAFDASGNPTPALLTSSGSLTAAIIAGLLTPQTPAESSQNIVPTATVYWESDVRRYGFSSTASAAVNAAAINTAIVVANAGGRAVELPGGTYNYNSTILLPVTPNTGQVLIRGQGRAATTLNYTGNAAAVGTAVASTRIYDCTLRDFSIANSNGSGGVGNGTVGLDLDSVSSSKFERLQITNFPTGVQERSTINGGCVYNRFDDVTVQAVASNVIAGFVINTKGSNAGEFNACRYNGPNNTVGTAVQIIDSSGVAFRGFNIDQALTGFALTAPSGAGFCDSNIIEGGRYEGCATVYSLGANVRYTKIGPNMEETFTTLISDSGTRNNFYGPPSQSYEQYAGAGLATGTKRIAITADIGANPAVVITDTGTTTVGSTVLQVETSSSNEMLVRLRKAGVDQATIDSTGTFATLGKLGINGVTPPARVAGFGTPTGTGVIANFPGASATLAQCSQAIAQIITDLKAMGIYGA